MDESKEQNVEHEKEKSQMNTCLMIPFAKSAKGMKLSNTFLI